MKTREVKLGEVANVKGGKRIPKGIGLINIPNGHPYIRVRDLNNKRLLELDNSYEYVDNETQKVISKYTVKAGDVVLSIVGTIGLVAIVGRTLDGANLTENCVKLSSFHGVNRDFLYYYLRSDCGQQEIRCGTVGAVQAKLPIKNIQNIAINLPDYTTQERIASLLLSIDRKIELNQKINDNLEQQAVALFKSWFVDFSLFGGTVPENWEDTTLENITTLITRGIAPKYSDNSDQTVVNQKCIRNHTIDLSLARTHTPKAINEKWLKFGDLLINSTGDGTLGRVAQVWFAPKALTVDSHVTIVRPAREELIFYIGLWGILHEKEIESLHTGSTGQTELPRDRVKMLKLLLPDNISLSRFTVVKITYGGSGGKTLSLKEINAQINELLKASIQSQGVISLFDSKKADENISLFDPAVLDEISKMKEKNIAVEILKKLMAEQVSLYKRTNVVQSQKFSEKITQLMNSYYNGLITNEEVIKELLKTAQEITELYNNGKKLGLTQEELAFYDALTKPENIKDFYQNNELIDLTRELTEMLRKNRTIDWQKKETARASMRKMVKHLLKKYKYPPEDYDTAISTVISQCEMWTDNMTI